MKHDAYALVTGASRGLGMAFARELAQRHYNLILVARSQEPLEALASELRKTSPATVVAISTDLSSPGASQTLAERIASDAIPVELLINNAGFGLRGEFRALSLPRQLEMLRLNNAAILELTYSLLPAMLERPQKGIINISSTGGFQPIPFSAAYSATKAFLTTFSLALEQELHGAGVTIVTVCPGRLSKHQNGHSEQPARGRWAGIFQSPEEVVRDALRTLAAGGGLTIPGALNKFSVFAQRLIPRKVVPRIVAKMSKT
jgi:short-subunit dehydrogenase